MEDRLGSLIVRRALLSLLLAAGLLLGAPAHAADPGARLADAHEALWQWRLTEAAAALAEAAPAGPREQRRQLLLARLELQRSRFEAVDRRLSPLIAQRPDAPFEARVILGRALYALGEKTRAYAVLDAMAVAYNDDKVQSAEDLMWLGVGLWLTDYPKNANQVFQEALDADPELHRARVLWAGLFSEKYNFRDADDLYREVLAKLPDDIPARVGRGAIDIDSDRDYTSARERAEAVLAVAPEAVPAHNLLARIELDNERHAAAVERLEGHSLRLAPRDPEALALLGAAAFLADDARAFAAAEKRALALNPRFAAFYTTVSQHGARMHRYAEAAALDQRALQLDPEHWRAYGNLGIGMSRLGDDERARSYLEKAFDGDPYDVRTFNMLDLFYDRTIRRYEWIEAAPMRARVHRDERPVLERYVPALLTEAYAHLSKKYRLQPDPPLHVEIFPDPQLFAVRSIGLPQLAAHGICFGHVITARSPSAGDFNWAEVLWHELSHVFHIQLSKSRVPRWFTEGLAVFEATEGRPAWQREMDHTLLAYQEAGRLRGVEDFNLSFTRAKNMQDILVAYYHSYRMAQFIDERFGVERMRKMLVAWGQQRPTARVFREALGVRDLADFDKRFLQWLDGKLAHLKRSFRLDADVAAAEAEARAEAADKTPDDAIAQARAAVAWLGRQDAEQALRYAERALARDPRQPHASLVRGMLRLSKGDAPGARADLEAVLGQGLDGVEVRTALAKATQAAGDAAAAITHLEAAIGVDPQRGELYHAVIGLLDDDGREADAYRWRVRAAQVDQGNVALVDALLNGAAKHGASKEDVLRWGEQGNHIAPMDAEHHVAFARELARLGLDEQARFEAASALLIVPGHQEALRLAE